MTVTKHELIDTIQRELGVTGTPIGKAQVAAVLERLGRLKVSERAARTGRNPQTGAEIEIPAKRLVKLTTAKALDVHLNS